MLQLQHGVTYDRLDIRTPLTNDMLAAIRREAGNADSTYMMIIGARTIVWCNDATSATAIANMLIGCYVPFEYASRPYEGIHNVI